MTNSSNFAGFAGAAYAYGVGRTNEFSGLENMSATAMQDDIRPLKAYHFHVYFDAEQTELATQFCQHVASKFSLHMGRVWPEPVGPHPRGSCQLSVPLHKFGDVTAWLIANRGPFTVFVHGLSGDDIADHAFHTLWLGDSEQLDLSALN